MSSPVIITGGAGFLGRLLTEKLLQSDPGCSITIVDRVEAARSGVASVVAELEGAGEAIRPILAAGPCRLFHLASVVSAAAEQDWDDAIEANVAGLIRLVKELRDSGHVHRLVFASSVAVFGGELAGGDPGDDTKQTPRSTYGSTKAIAELLINDATRKGFLDGRTARLPTVVVRPGRPNAAASSFCSGMFREPLAGEQSVIPVQPDVPVVLIGADTAVDCLMALSELDGAQLVQSRAVSLPGLRVTVAEMVAALAEVGGREATDLLSYGFDTGVNDIITGWPGMWDDSRARSIGLPADDSLVDVVERYRTSLS